MLPHLYNIYGEDNILAGSRGVPKGCKLFEKMDVTNKERFEDVIKAFKPDCLIHMAAILSANGEKTPDLCYETNVTGFKHALDLCVKYKMLCYCPSTIAAFGPTSPLKNAPNQCI